MVVPQAILAEMPWQRCQFHFMRNGMAHVLKIAMRAEIASALRRVMAANNHCTARTSTKMRVAGVLSAFVELSGWGDPPYLSQAQSDRRFGSCWRMHRLISVHCPRPPWLKTRIQYAEYQLIRWQSSDRCRSPEYRGPGWESAPSPPFAGSTDRAPLEARHPLASESAPDFRKAGPLLARPRQGCLAPAPRLQRR
jgi:hypothetical protein